MLSLNSYSQQDTTKVVLTTNIARLVYKDLIRYDGCKEELSLTQFKLSKVEEREFHKDTIINLLTEKDKNNQFIIGKKDEQLSLSQELSSKLEKELKGQNRKLFFYKALSFISLVTVTFLISK
jgi:phosphotransferase system IIB component